MFIVNLFAGLGFWDSVYLIFVCIVVLIAGCYVYGYVTSNPIKYIHIINDANRAGRVAVGKLTCLTVHGNGAPQHYQAEYMYIVDGKKYFVTYQMAFSINVDDSKDAMNADMILLNLKPAMLFFYKKNPKNVICKAEAFVSYDCLHQIHTPKKNAYRDVEKDWVEAISLVNY